MAVMFPGYTTAETALLVGKARSITIDTDLNLLILHDGVTPGGAPFTGQTGMVFYGTGDPPEGTYPNGSLYLKIEEE
ncbi:hypothetical protein [Desulfobacula sp.]|uniref:hypothetical protein n=1 Tax=Desulfobacula sp. TaxID=2593537 RepID=UPI002637823D|nr:hypothetical protein [Desulfobacula sp.]